jgi:predicted protein tyrosine phosphatase
MICEEINKNIGHCLFVCTSNYDRSPALEKHFREHYPFLIYRSAGINKYHCSKKGTNYLKQSDIDWADFIVFCEDIHKDIVFRNYTFYNSDNPTKMKHGLTLRLGNYEKGNITDEYLKRAEIKLKPLLEKIEPMENHLPAPKTIEELVRFLHASFSKTDAVNFAIDIKSNDAHDYAIRHHDSIGRFIRNSFGLWKRDSELCAYCISIGLNEPDDMSYVILKELHKLAMAELNEQPYSFSLEKETVKSMNVFALHGHKVRVTSKTLNNGELEDSEHVLQHLNVDYTYTVDATNVNDFSTDVYLQEREGIKFNSINFEDVHPQSLEFDQKHPDYSKYN